MATTLVTLTGDVTDAIGTNFDPRRTKAYVRHNTPKIVTDEGPIHLGGGTVNVAADGTFTLPNVVASTSLVENLQATVYVDYEDRTTRQRATATFGPYDLSGETGTVDVRDLEAVQALDPSFASETMAAMQQLLAEMEEISGLTGEDEAVALLINTPSSDTAGALTASYVALDRPAYAPPATFTNPWDQRRSVYNLHRSSFPNWGPKYALAVAGSGQAHLSTFIDSITKGNTSAHPWKGAWPARLRRRFDAICGPAGTGIRVPWDDLGDTGTPATDPEWTFGASGITSPGYGVYAVGAKKADGGAEITFDTGAIGAECEEFWVYVINWTTEFTVLKVDAGATLVAGTSPYIDVASPRAGQHTLRIDAEPGTPTLDEHVLHIYGYPTWVVGVEGRIPGQGVRVSNLGRNGRATGSLVLDDSSNFLGMDVAFDLFDSDLAVMLLGMNDFQGHVSVATFKSNVRTAIQRQRAAGGDVLLGAIYPPDFAEIPADHVQTPAFDLYLTALYELADEEDVPLLDLAHRWQSYAASEDRFFDALHPNDYGAEDIAQAVFDVVAGA